MSGFIDRKPSLLNLVRLPRYREPILLHFRPRPDPTQSATVRLQATQ